jgi:hypothetical protein
MSLNAHILVGDCYGVDSAVQSYLKSRRYEQVTVYHIGSKPRCNVGYPTVATVGSYTTRDGVMCSHADYGLAIWDGRSPGTKANIARVPTRVVMG